MRNARLDETQAGIKIAGRNINNLRYADDNTLMAENEEDLKSLLMTQTINCFLFSRNARARSMSIELRLHHHQPQGAA